MSSTDRALIAPGRKTATRVSVSPIERMICSSEIMLASLGMSRAAADLLLRSLQADPTQVVPDVEMPVPELVVRGSTGGRSAGGRRARV